MTFKKSTFWATMFAMYFMMFVAIMCYPDFPKAGIDRTIFVVSVGISIVGILFSLWAYAGYLCNVTENKILFEVRRVTH